MFSDTDMQRDEVLVKIARNGKLCQSFWNSCLHMLWQIAQELAQNESKCWYICDDVYSVTITIPANSAYTISQLCQIGRSHSKALTHSYCKGRCAQ